uniref:Uncharacterized protein n=1 Tax=Solanum lycopersicum TaxID=4081 RepID=A0A3Q7H7K4_SOLLC
MDLGDNFYFTNTLVLPVVNGPTEGLMLIYLSHFFTALVGKLGFSLFPPHFEIHVKLPNRTSLLMSSLIPGYPGSEWWAQPFGKSMPLVSWVPFLNEIPTNKAVLFLMVVFAVIPTVYCKLNHPFSVFEIPKLLSPSLTCKTKETRKKSDLVSLQSFTFCTQLSTPNSMPPITLTQLRKSFIPICRND